MSDINISDVTNEDSTGIFDVLMKSINTHIEKQYRENRLTGTEYANVYLGSVQAALAQSIQFNLQNQLVSAQIAGALADNLLKAKQLETAEIEKTVKQYELDNVLPKQLEITSVEKDAKQYELDNLLPQQLEKIQEEVDLLQTQDSEIKLDGTKKRLIMDEELETAGLQQVLLVTEQSIKTKQLVEITDATVRANTQLADGLETSSVQRDVMYVDRVLKDKQAAKLGLDSVMKRSEVSRNADNNFVYMPEYISTPQE